jgi:hypothetical protein
MNDAETKRDARIANMNNGQLLAYLGANDSDLTVYERAAFPTMAPKRMTATQRHWAITVVRRIMPLDAAEVPRGKPVDTYLWASRPRPS